MCIHISHASAVKPEISMCSFIDIVLHSMKCIVTILEPDFHLLSVEYSFFLKSQIKLQFHFKIIKKGDIFSPEVYKATLKSYVYFNMERKMINNKLDSMRLKFHFSNSFGTLEGTLIP